MRSETSATVPSCHLYTLEPSNRIRNELLERGLDIDAIKTDEASVDVLTLNQFDGMRYEPTVGTEKFRSHLDNQFGSEAPVSVLDVGSGFGGPARLLALTRPNTKLVALEFVPEISDIAKSLTELTQVYDCIHHVTGDVCSDVPSQTFHAAQAALSLLHIPDINLALSTVCQQLEPNGIIYIEDFCVKSRDMSDKSQEYLKDIVGCPRKPMTREEWISTLAKAGFQGEIEFQDVTNAWKPWVHKRKLEYSNNMDRHIRVHGNEMANHMLEFYETVDTLFSKELCGCRILAKKC
jgi:SAM-dependent methyltransferase